MIDLLDQLNDVQREAVTSEPANLLILAGAGSGKTRVLTRRIAWLLSEGVSPLSVLAVTFTNKAANEMRGRIEKLCNIPSYHMWVGTFHGLSHRLLRIHWKEAKLLQDFQILDSADQLRLVKRVHKHLNLEEKRTPAKQSQWFINKQKEEGLRSADVQGASDPFYKVMQEVYAEYEKICEQSGLVDFAELLLRSLELLKNNEMLSEHYGRRFQHILVDEFQDTNTIQYAWLKQLKNDNNYMLVVGDDDQSIYSWRGARIENIHRFAQEYKNAKTIRLEQNYRSTQTILDAANAVISCNLNRLGKKLWTDGDTGLPVSLYAAYQEYDEASFVVSQIQQWLQKGSFKYSDFAVLYRSNAQSRVLEEALLREKIPYRIYGGMKFFERAEIKDALAYLRLIANRHDDAAFERVVNMPTRGIGLVTLSLLRQTSRAHQVSLWQASKQLIEAKALSPRALESLGGFLKLIDELEKVVRDLPLEEQAEQMLELSGLIAYYRADQTEKGVAKVENLEEFINAASEFSPSEDLENMSILSAFLSHVALESGEMQADEFEESVNLMTLHSAKGLEFPVVFIVGLEEDLFPHYMSIDEPQGLEEERRLCYVGMTRAMKKLYLTYAQTRRLHGQEKYNRPSRFLEEVPEELMDAVRPVVKVSRPVTYKRKLTSEFKKPKNLSKDSIRAALKKTLSSETEYSLGQQVHHKKFGAGMIVDYEGDGESLRLQVKFNRAGTKWLVASFAKLEKI